MQAFKNEKYNDIKYSKPTNYTITDWNMIGMNNLKHFSIEKSKNQVFVDVQFFHLNAQLIRKDEWLVIYLRNDSHELLAI